MNPNNSETLRHDLDAAIADVAKGINEAMDDQDRPAAEPVPLRTRLASATPPNGTSAAPPKPVKSTTDELADFLARGDRMVEQQRRRLRTLESDYRMQRTALWDRWMTKLAEVEHEADEALRTFDNERKAQIKAAQEMLDRLLAMRDRGESDR